LNVCVCLYSSYQLILSFSHLVVTLTTLGTPKNIFCFNNNIMNDNSKQDHPGKNKFGCSLFAELGGRDMRTLPRMFRLFCYLNQASQKNSCQIFLPKKIPESKISNPKKSFDHPRHLKSGVPPWAWGTLNMQRSLRSAAWDTFLHSSCLLL